MLEKDKKEIILYTSCYSVGSPGFTSLTGCRSITIQQMIVYLLAFSIDYSTYYI